MIGAGEALTDQTFDPQVVNDVANEVDSCSAERSVINIGYLWRKPFGN